MASLLIPAIGNVRTQANASRALNNMKRLVEAEIQYASDNNQSFTTLWTSTNQVVWQQQLLPYIAPNAPVYRVTLDYRSNPQSVFNVPEAKLAVGQASIGLNSYMGSNGWKYRANVMTRPSSTILLGEIVEKNNDGIQPSDLTLGYSAPGFRRQNRTRAIVAFCDGHVAAMTREELSSTNAQNLWFWW